MPTYRFQPLAELGWGVVIAGAVVILTGLLDLTPTTDLRAWGLALGVGALRAMAGAALDWIRRSMAAPVEPTPAELRARQYDAVSAERRGRGDA